PGDPVAGLQAGPIDEPLVAWQPGGDRLAVAGSDPRIQIWNVSARTKVATLEGHVQEVVQVTFHPQADLLASTSWDGFVRLWDPATGRQLLQFSATVNCRFSLDGRYLGFARHGEHTQLLELKPTREYRTLGYGPESITRALNKDSDFSPDGRILALPDHDATRFLHLASGRELAALPPGQ